MIKYLDLRTKNYEDRKKRNINFDFNINDWYKSPYSCLKARVYIELSTIFAFFFSIYLYNSKSYFIDLLY